MNVEPIIFFDMVGAIFILAVALAASVFYLAHIIKKIQQKQNTQDQTLENNMDIMNNARQKAIKMIDEANNKALDIINKANLSTDIASQNFNDQISRITSAQIKQLENSTQDFTKIYDQVLKDLKTKNIEMFQNISKDIEENTMNEIKNFKDSVAELTISSQKTIQEKIDQNYEVTTKEIEGYKTAQMKKFDDGIFSLLEKVSKLVLGKTISLSEHEDLILKALERAKKEGVFE